MWKKKRLGEKAKEKSKRKIELIEMRKTARNQ